MAAKAVYLSARGIVTELVKSPAPGAMSVAGGCIPPKEIMKGYNCRFMVFPACLAAVAGYLRCHLVVMR
jgi:hypothetical protein